MNFFPRPLKNSKITVLATIAIVVLWTISGPAGAQDSFLKGKTVRIIQGRSPGGTGDMRVRSLIPFLRKYLPGNPTIVMEYMPGGGSRKAANYIFQSESSDGLMIGNMSSGMVYSGVLGAKGVSYDVEKFFYLGSPFNSHHAVFLTRKEAGLDSIEKLRATNGLRIGGQSVGFSTYNEGRLFAYILGLKNPRFVTGYGGAELDPAIMRGELDGRSSSADTVLKRNPDWLKKHQVNFHAIIEVPKGEKHTTFHYVPDLETFAKSETDHKVMAMQRAFRQVGQPFVLPPSTAKDRVKIIQEAFRKSYQDPAFPKEYKKFTADDATPLLPENHAKVIREIPKDAEVRAIFKKLVGAGPLPPR